MDYHSNIKPTLNIMIYSWWDVPHSVGFPTPCIKSDIYESKILIRHSKSLIYETILYSSIVMDLYTMNYPHKVWSYSRWGHPHSHVIRYEKLMIQDGVQEVHLCDVMYFQSSQCIMHTISIKPHPTVCPRQLYSVMNFSFLHCSDTINT